MMKLSNLIQGEKETQDEYLDRTHWTLDHVQEYNSIHERNNPTIQPQKIITIQEAREYLVTLTPTTHRYHVPTEDASTPGQKELIKIELEPIGNQPDGWIWIDSCSGKIMHTIGKEKKTWQK